MLFDIVRVGLLYAEQVFIGYILLIAASALFYIELKVTNRSMQVNQYIGLGELLIDNVEQTLVQ